MICDGAKGIGSRLQTVDAAAKLIEIGPKTLRADAMKTCSIQRLELVNDHVHPGKKRGDVPRGFLDGGLINIADDAAREPGVGHDGVGGHNAPGGRPGTVPSTTCTSGEPARRASLSHEGDWGLAPRPACPASSRPCRNPPSLQDQGANLTLPSCRGAPYLARRSGGRDSKQTLPQVHPEFVVIAVPIVIILTLSSAAVKLANQLSGVGVDPLPLISYKWMFAFVLNAT